MAKNCLYCKYYDMELKKCTNYCEYTPLIEKPKPRRREKDIERDLTGEIIEWWDT